MGENDENKKETEEKSRVNGSGVNDSGANDSRVDDSGVDDSKEQSTKQEFWSNNPMHEDYTAEGDKKSWSFYLAHRGKPKGTGVQDGLSMSKEVCLSQYPGDAEVENDYDRAVVEGKDPVKAVEDGVAKRKRVIDPRVKDPRVTDPRDKVSRDNDSKEIKMEVILGKPNTRGHSDIVDNFDSEKLVLAGTVVKRTGEDTVAVFNGTGLPIGVAGYRQIEGQARIAVNINGLGIGVLLANPAEEITIGSQVYVTKEGKVTGISKDNTPLRAVFASRKGDGVDVLNKTKVFGGAVRIDMLGI